MPEFERPSRTQNGHLVSPARPDQATPQPVHAANTVPAQQQALGNQAMQRFAQSCPLALPSPSLCPFGGVCHTCPSRVQAKLTINQPGDKYEQEADRVAEQIMRMPDPYTHEGAAVSERSQGIHIQQACTECDDELRRQPLDEEEEEEEILQVKEVPGHTPQVTPDLVGQINGLRGRGQPLPESEHAFFEPLFRHDFGQVRIHADVRAAEAARTVNARAFTLGRDVVFEAGQYAPGTMRGRKLLAHELTHVVQQTASDLPETPLIQLAPTPNPTSPPTLRYDATYGPSSTHCAVYQSPLARTWFTYSYRNNAECACLNTPNEPHNNCVRKCLQEKMRAHLAWLNRMGAALPWTFPGEADPLCHDMWEQHVECYRECGCANEFINYPVFSVMCRSPFPCFVVGGSIEWFNACM